MSTVEYNIERVRAAIAAVNAGTILDEFVAPECVRHDLNRAFPDFIGPGGMAEFLRQVRSGLPDFRVEIDDIYGSGDRVVARLMFSGTHRGEILGMAPTGRYLEFNAINMYRLRDGQLVETWQLSDLWGFFTQIRSTSPS